MKVSIDLGSVRWHSDEGSISALKRAAVGAIDALTRFKDASNNIEVIVIKPQVGGVCAPSNLSVLLVMSTQGGEKHADSFYVNKTAEDVPELVISGIQPILRKYLNDRLREKEKLAEEFRSRISFL